MKRTAMVIVAAVLAAGTGVWLRAQESDSPQTRPRGAELTTKIYDVRLLLAEHRDTSYKGLVLTVGDGDMALSGDRSAAASGLFGAGSGGGAGAGSSGLYGVAPQGEPLAPAMAEIVASVQSLTGDEIWLDHMEATVKALGSRLVIHQTAEGHKMVAQAIAQLHAMANEQVVVDAVWVRSDGADKAHRLGGSDEPAAPRTMAPDALAKADLAWRGRVTCFNAQQSYALAGRSQLAVVGFGVLAGEINGTIKVTGDPIAGPATQPAVKPEDKKPAVTFNVNSVTVPIVRMAHVGMAMDVRPVLGHDRKNCFVEISGVINRSRTDKPSPIDKAALTPMDFDAQVFAASATVPLGQWVIVTGCTVSEGLGKGEMYLAIRATRIEP
ncbi:MAG: hypothetical protein NTV86_23450 [Planctomycetota bacterium]|nr:hypothetical protein [Planctomycetota bacterium]